MTFQLAGALLSLLPGLALLCSKPGRAWPSWIAAALSIAGTAVGAVLFSGAEIAAVAVIGASSALGCAYAAVLAGRDGEQSAELRGQLRSAEVKKSELAQAVAVAREKGLKTEREQRDVLALYALVKGLAESLSWEEAKPRLEMAVQQCLGVEEFAIFGADLHSSNQLRPLSVRKLSSSVGSNWDTLVRLFQERGMSMAVPNALDRPESAVALPIRDANELMGFFYARCPAALDPKELLEKSVAFYDEIAFAFRRIKLFQELEGLSQIDGLTGVARRGVLDERLREETIRARTFKISYCVLLLDIDHFKKLNDTYGHPFGDQVLRRVGEILRASVYETDFVARYGGEEFAVLLPRGEPVGVLRKAEAIRAAIESEPFALAMQTIHVTVSIGVAHFPRDGGAEDIIISQADKALYHAKETGRNRVVDIMDVPGKKIHGKQ